MSITVVVALEQRAESDKPRSEEITLQGTVLTAKNAELARTLAFGSDASAVVAHGWRDAFYVPSSSASRKRRGVRCGRIYRMWSPEDTRRLFGKSEE